MGLRLGSVRYTAATFAAVLSISAFAGAQTQPAPAAPPAPAAQPVPGAQPAPGASAAQSRGGLTEEEQQAADLNKLLRPHASPGFKAWFFDFGWKMSFDNNPANLKPAEPGYIKVDTNEPYSKEKGYGWVLDPATQRYQGWHYPGPSSWYGYTYLGHNEHWNFRGRNLDIWTPLEKDYASAFRRYGFSIDGLPDPGDLDRTMCGAQYVKDDSEAEFVVDVLPGKHEYSILMEVGDNEDNTNVQVENEQMYEFQWRGNPKYRFMYIPADGQLHFKFRAKRAAAMGGSGTWALGPRWNVAYMAIFEAQDEQGLYGEDWRIIKNKFYAAKKAIYVSVNRLQARVEDFHIVVDERPHWDVQLQNHAWPVFDRFARFYSLGNAYSSSGLGTDLTKLLTSNNFMAADRFEKSYYEDYPYELIDSLNTVYDSGFFGRPQFDGRQLEFMPKYLQGESPLMASPDGRSLGRAPLGSKLQRELIREFLEFLACHVSDHPALMGYDLYEELETLPAQTGYDNESVNNYREYLAQKYRTIQGLNAAWGTKYEDFGKIKPAPYAAFGGANYVDWQNFKSKMTGDDLMLCRQKLHELEPWSLAIGGSARPSTGDTITWDWMPSVDLSYQPGDYWLKMIWPAQLYWAKQGYNIAVQSKTLKAGGSNVGGTSRNCPYTHYFSGVYRKGQSLWGGRKDPQRTPQETQLAVDACDGFNCVLHAVFHGQKSIMWESQESFADTHMLHFAKWYHDVLAEGGEFRNEYNDLMWFAPQALTGAPVRICLPFLYAQRANEVMFRTAPLMLPAQPMDAEVGILATGETIFPISDKGNNGVRSFRQPLNNIGALLDSLQVGGWGVREDDFDSIYKYKVVIIGPAAQMITRQQAEKLKDYVAKGGRLVFINNGAATDGATLYSRKDMAPLWGLDKLAGCKVKKVEDQGFPELFEAEKETQSSYGYESLQLYSGSVAMRKDGEDVTAARSADGKCYYILDKGFDKGYYKDINKEAKDIRDLLGEIFATIGVRKNVAIEKAADPAHIYTGVLKGKDCWIVGVLNSGLKDQAMLAKLNFLPAGDYSVMDITGQRPLLKYTDQKSWYLEKDSQSRERLLTSRISAADLAGKGLELDCVTKGGRLLLVRNAGADVWLNMPEYEVLGLMLQYHRKNPSVDARVDPRPAQTPVYVVLGSGAASAQKAAAGRLVDMMTSRKVKASIVSDTEMMKKVKRTHTEVRLPTRTAGAKDDYVMNVFDNEIFDTDGNLVVIGNENNNAVARQLAKDGAYAYDKVLVKVSSSFPGSGIGVIQVVESINNEGNDARFVSKSAIMIGGSDDAGTQKALDRVTSMIDAGTRLDPRKYAQRYGFGLEKRPEYIKPVKKKPATAPAK